MAFVLCPCSEVTLGEFCQWAEVISKTCSTKLSQSVIVLKSLYKDFLYAPFQYMLSQNVFAADNFKPYSLKRLQARVQFIKLDTDSPNIRLLRNTFVHQMA
jgi:hypothetical protein